MLHHLRQRFREASQRDLITSSVIAALLITALGVFTTYVYVLTFEQQHQRDYAAAKQSELRNTSAYIYNKFVAYRQILLSGTTAVKLKTIDGISLSDWNKYYETNLIQNNFPGIIGVGFAPYGTSEQLQPILEKVQADNPTFSLTPAGDRSYYTPILFLAPSSVANTKAIGFDMFSESARHSAMSKARDSGSFSMTAPVKLVQDNNKTQGKGGLLYYPIYKGDDPGIKEERRQSAQAFVYVSFNVHRMMEGREKDLAPQGITYKIEDITSGKPESIYSFTKGSVSRGDMVSGDLSIASRIWRLTMHIPNSVAGTSIKPMMLFIGGVLGSMLLGAFVYSFLRSRVSKIYLRHEDELQNTKDELLALASHQLRTPASGVKQYIDMLRLGYFGELNPEQLTIAGKAYSANDRQLEIIDQLLYVAKADAGQLILQPDEVDLVELAQTVRDDLTTTAKTKQIILKLTTPRSLKAFADARFVRMIMENLVSNAIKYSYPDSTIHIKLNSSKGFARFSVTDKGVGIDTDDLKQLFKKFSRIQNPLSTREGGSGLGLYLAQRLAEAHGGNIGVTSEKDKGSQFTLMLPKAHYGSENVIQLTE